MVNTIRDPLGMGVGEGGDGGTEGCWVLGCIQKHHCTCVFQPSCI